MYAPKKWYMAEPAPFRLLTQSWLWAGSESAFSLYWPCLPPPEYIYALDQVVSLAAESPKLFCRLKPVPLSCQQVFPHSCTSWACKVNVGVKAKFEQPPLSHAAAATCAYPVWVDVSSQAKLSVLTPE